MYSPLTLTVILDSSSIDGFVVPPVGSIKYYLLTPNNPVNVELDLGPLKSNDIILKSTLNMRLPVDISNPHKIMLNEVTIVENEEVITPLDFGIKYQDENNVWWLSFNISKLYTRDIAGGTVHLRITTTSETVNICKSSYFVSDHKHITEYAPPFIYHENQKYLSNQVGESLSYSLNVINSFTTIKKSLFNDTLPYDLSLYFDEYDFSTFKFMPNRCKLSVQEQLIITSNKITYIDGSFNRYYFIKTSLSGYYYYDKYGSGMLIIYDSNNNRYKLFANQTKAYKLFDSQGYLIKIVDEYNRSIDITYSSSSSGNPPYLRETITDYLGNSVRIYQSSGSIQIVIGVIVDNVFQTRYTYTLYTDSINRLIQIDENNRGNTGFSYVGSSSLISEIDEYTNNVLLLTRDSNNRIVRIDEKYNSSTRESYLIHYFYQKSEVTNRHNVKTRYIYDEDGMITSVLEINNGTPKLDYFDIEEEIRRYIGSTDNEKGLVYEDPNPTLYNLDNYTSSDLTVNLTQTSTINGGFTTFKTNKKYIAFIDIHREGEPTLSDKEDLITISPQFSPFGSYSSIATLPYKLDDDYRGLVYIFSPTGTAVTDPFFFRVQVKASKKISSLSIRINQIRIYEYTKSIEQIDQFNDPESLVPDLELPNFIGLKINNNLYCNFTLSDLVLNKLNIKRHKGFLWMNNKREMICFDPNTPPQYKYVDSNHPLTNSEIETLKGFHGSPITDTTLNNKFENLPSRQFTFTIFGTKIIERSIDEQDNQHIFYSLNYMSFSDDNYTHYKIKYIDNQSIETAETTDEYHRVTEKQDGEGHFTHYDYDNHGNVIKESFKKVGVLVTSINTYYEYDAKNRLTGTSSIINDVISTTSFSYSLNHTSPTSITDGENKVESYTFDNDYLKVMGISRYLSSIQNTYNSYNQLTKTDNDSSFNFSYDSYGLLNSVSVKTGTNTYQTIISLTNTLHEDGDRVKYQYPNSFYEEIYYDKYNNIIKIDNSSNHSDYLYFDEKPSTIESETTSSTYFGKAKLYKIIDRMDNSRCHYFDYQGDGLLSSYLYKTRTNSLLTEIAYTYDDYLRLSQKVFSAFTRHLTIDYTYKSIFSNQITKIENTLTKDNDSTTNYLYEEITRDDFNRINKVNSSNDVLSMYSIYRYKNNAGTGESSIHPYRVDDYKKTISTTYLKSTYIYYDRNSNITGFRNGTTSSPISNTGNDFEYDYLNQLTKEKIYDSSSLQGEYIYSYDNNGNITSVVKKDLNGNIISIDTYQYNSFFKDKLTSFNSLSVSYDSNFNITSIGSSLTFSWTRGRLLSSVVKNGVVTTFSYNHLGLRVSKTHTAGATRSYYYDESNRLITERISIGGNTTTLTYLYGLTGLIGICKDSTLYRIKRNILGDVESIFEGNVLQARYIYDAYGNHVVLDSSGNVITNQNHIGLLNPFRYRSYYYDNETGLYYCESRYYYPVIRRWINIDQYQYLDNQSIGGLNLFAYCQNNPINYVDPEGTLFGLTAFLSALIIGAAAGFAVGATVETVKQLVEVNGNWGKINWLSVLEEGVMGGAFGAATVLGGAAGLTSIGGLISGYSLTFGESLALAMSITSLASMACYSIESAANNNFDFGTMLYHGFRGAAKGAATFGIGYIGGTHGIFTGIKGYSLNILTLRQTFNGRLSQFFWNDKLLRVNWFLFKMFKVSLPASGIRRILDLFIPKGFFET